MSAEVTIHAILAGTSDITALVSDRIYPIVVPDKGLPAIAYLRTGTEYTNTIGNAAIAARVTFELFCVSKLFSEAELLADKVSTTSLAKLNRISDYDADTETFVAIITIEAWET